MTTLSLQPQQLSLVKAGLELRRRALNFGLARYRERLAEFERRYGFDSQTFIKRFEAGELGDESDWFEWQYVWEAFTETQRQIGLLDSITL